MLAFQQSGNTVTFTAATTPPTPAQCVAANNAGPTYQYVLTNVGQVAAFVGMGVTAAEATANSAVPGTARCYPLLPGTQVVITGPANAYFSGDTASSTAVVYVTPGYGI